MILDYEKLVISGMLKADRETQIELLSDLDSPGLFLNEKYHKIIAGLFKCSFAKVDIGPVSVTEVLNGELTINEILEISHYTKDAKDLRAHLSILKVHRYKRELTLLAKEFTQDMDCLTFADDLDEIKNRTIVKLNSINVADKSEFIDFGFHKTKIAKQMKRVDGLQGFSWGINAIDKMTSGIVLPRTYVIGGLKKSGKTRFVIHTIKKLIEQNVSTAFLSLEMPAYEVTKLTMASMLNIEDYKLDGPYLTDEEKSKFANLTLNDKPLAVECKSSLKLTHVLSRIRLYSKLGYKVVFIDYLQRIDHDRKRQAQELEEISIQISDAGRINNVAIILLSQLNNLGEREIPNVGHLKGSGGIAESVDSIILFDNVYRRTKKEEDKNCIDLYFEQRYSPSGLKSIYADLGAIQFKEMIKTNRKIETVMEL